jgi:hypothetical protein
MKKLLKRKLCALLMPIVLIVGCSKKAPNTTTPIINNPNTAPIAANGTVIFNGKTYPIISVNAYGKYNEKTYNLDVDLSNSDSIIHLFISMASYLPVSATKAFSNNIMPLGSNEVSWVLALTNKTTFNYYQESSTTAKSGDIIIAHSNNEIQYVTNNSQGFKMDASMGSKISFNIKKSNPTIPTAKTTYIIPSGMDANNITLGNTITWNHITDFSRHVISNENGHSKALVQFTGTDVKELDFYFNDGLPVSGVYDIVTSENAVAPGKVYVKLTTLTPVALYSSNNINQKVIVENINGVVKIYAKDIDLGADKLNAFITF